MDTRDTKNTTKTTTPIFCQRVQIAAAEEGLSAAEIAKRAGIAVPTVHHILNGKRGSRPSPRIVHGLAVALNRTEAWLTGVESADVSGSHSSTRDSGDTRYLKRKVVRRLLAKRPEWDDDMLQAFDAVELDEDDTGDYDCWNRKAQEIARLWVEMNQASERVFGAQLPKQQAAPASKLKQPEDEDIPKRKRGER